MSIKSNIRLLAAGFVLPVVMAGAANAASVQVAVTNNQAADGLFFTPLASIFHDGSFDTFDPGGSASSSVEEVAETGSPAGIIGDAQSAGFIAGAVTGPAGFGSGAGQPPVLDPGETGTQRFNGLNAVDNRYFSYLSMIIPSNDLFVGNSDPIAHEIFDDMGKFVGATIEIFTSRIYDAGTEANDNLGAAFNGNGGTETETMDPISLVANLLVPGTDDPLVFILGGQPTAAGTTVNLQNGATLLATIEISQVPLPAAAPLLLAGLGGLGFAAKRRRKAA